MKSVAAQKPKEFDVKRWGSLLFFLLVVVLVSWWGSRFLPGEWYAGLVKPSWNPPSWVFGPVWSLLYVMMAVAAWQVWNSDHERRLPAVTLWLVQLLFNGAWSWLFFGLNRPGIAMFELAFLLALVVATTILFRIIRPSAALLMVPYVLWLAFALALNVALWNLNGGSVSTLIP
jgi:tryptophan-rich sensory protein